MDGQNFAKKKILFLLLLTKQKNPRDFNFVKKSDDKKNLRATLKKIFLL